jgi:hypothetical protein
MLSCFDAEQDQREPVDKSNRILPDQTEWRDVPEAALRAWIDVFEASREGVDLSAACPVCGAHQLHRWFYRRRPADIVLRGQRFDALGGEWQWCSHCRSYIHYSSFVPDWWTTDVVVPLKALAHHPGPIDQVLRQRRPRQTDME